MAPVRVKWRRFIYAHMEAIMLAVALWCWGNQSAASLVGEKMTSGWAAAHSVWPHISRGKPHNTGGRHFRVAT